MRNAYQSMEAALATKAEATLLQVKHKSPVLLIERFTEDAQGRRIEYVKSVYRGDRYKFAIRLLAD
jgi:GntR family transcriptional regulator